MRIEGQAALAFAHSKQILDEQPLQMVLHEVLQIAQAARRPGPAGRILDDHESDVDGRHHDRPRAAGTLRATGSVVASASATVDVLLFSFEPARTADETSSAAGGGREMALRLSRAA